ncbi:S-layer homology domain-containing protein [Paenibacillus sp. 1P07SE]|uniref:S-layer homology domain-containing protein n=1 Tax=Paenibacillus sp. 1P07SE TaxID=3132209 RepID=UPI0039A471AD
MSNLLRKSRLLLLALCIACAMPVYAAADEDTAFELRGAATTVAVGDTVELRLGGAQLRQLYAMEATLTYDASALELTGVEQLVENSFAGEWQSASGEAKVYMTKLGSQSVSGEAELLMIRFKTLRAGESSVRLGAVETESADRTRSSYSGGGSSVVVRATSGGTGGWQPPAPPPQPAPEPEPEPELPSELVSSVEGEGAAAYRLNAEAFRLALAMLAEASGSGRLELPLTSHAGDASVSLSAQLSLLSEAAEAAPDAGLRLLADDRLSYELPLRLFDPAMLAELLQLSEAVLAQADLTIMLGPAELPAGIRASHRLASEAYAFTIVVREASGREHVLEQFGSLYAERGIVLETAVNPGSAGGVVYDPASMELQFVPTVFVQEGERQVAVLKRNSNSVYAVIDDSRSFADVSGHWAAEEIETLAAKLLLRGRSADVFAPGESVTRAEFAALLVRGFGLQPLAGEARFSDTAPGAWYTASVAAAVEAGYVNGYPDGTFRPQAPITREQMALMLERAITVYGAADVLPGEGSLAAFADRGEVSAWAESAVSRMIAGGLIQGVSEQRIAPQALTTRAQAAVLLARVLRAAELIS